MMSLAQRRVVARYRALVQDLALISFVAPARRFPPSIVVLVEWGAAGQRKNYEWSVDGWSERLWTDEDKQRVVEYARHAAEALSTHSSEDAEQAIAVWFVATGWIAPDDGTQPSKHREARRCVIVTESTLDGDRMFVREDTKWSSARVRPGSRFADLIGREKHVGHLRVVGKGPKS